MLYLKLFETEQERLSCADIYDYVAYVRESDKVYIHPYDYSQSYLTFIAKSNGTFNFSGSSNEEYIDNEIDKIINSIQYSTDNGTTWSALTQNATIDVNTGDKVLWKGEMTPIADEDNEIFVFVTFSASTATFNAQGNIMSLLYGDNFKNQTSLTGKDYAFYLLFGNEDEPGSNIQNPGSKIQNANNLILPPVTTIWGYGEMFSNCTLLVTAPNLPATTLTGRNCYSGMF